jgi:hypothetical protein
MPSPFPGMDPFLESEEWEDFRTRFNTAISDVLGPRVDPRYIVRVERRIYVEHADVDDDRPRRADMAVLSAEAGEPSRGAPATAAMVTLAPVECVLEMPEEIQETYLVVRLRETREVVTVLETLSPRNKRQGSDGRREYLEKRREVLQSQAHLVELDFLRGGKRLPMKSRLPPANYYAIVSRGPRRPRVDVYAWTIRDPLPTIPIPLKTGDPDVPLDLQAAFGTVYDRARYHLSLDYTRSLQPRLEESDRAWFQQRLASRRDVKGAGA